MNLTTKTADELLLALNVQVLSINREVIASLLDGLSDSAKRELASELQPAPTETALASFTVLASAHGATRTEAVADARRQLAELDEKRAALLMLLAETGSP